MRRAAVQHIRSDEVAFLGPFFIGGSPERLSFLQNFFCFILAMTVCATLRICGMVIKLQHILNIVQTPQRTSDHQSKKTKNYSII